MTRAQQIRGENENQTQNPRHVSQEEYNSDEESDEKNINYLPSLTFRAWTDFQSHKAEESVAQVLHDRPMRAHLSVTDLPEAEEQAEELPGAEEQLEESP